MKNRNKIIAIFFMLFILVIPAVTFVRGFKTTDSTGLTQEQKEILEGNGTYHEENEKATDEQVVVPEVEVEVVHNFEWLKGVLNTFIDRLFLKTKFVAFNAKLTSFLTGGEYVESNIALAGKDGWLFYKSEIDGHSIWDYMGVNHFSDEELARGAANLIETRDVLAQKGIDFVVTCLPNKEIVYEEYMPDTIARVDEVSRGQQFADYIHANTDLKYVYPKDALLAGKKDNLIYYKTDTHWNQLGSFIGLNEIFKLNYGVCDSFENAKFNFTPENYVGDIAFSSGLTDKYPLNDVYSLDVNTVDSKVYHDQKLLIVGDSFSGFLMVLSKPYYKEVKQVFVQDFTWDMVDEYDPDIVILEAVERYNERFVDIKFNEKNYLGFTP